MFIYTPSIMLQDDFFAVFEATAPAVSGICGISGFAAGWFGSSLGVPKHLLALAAGTRCFLPYPAFKFGGLVVVLLFAAFSILANRLRSREGSQEVQ